MHSIANKSDINNKTFCKRIDIYLDFIQKKKPRDKHGLGDILHIISVPAPFFSQLLGFSRPPYSGLPHRLSLSHLSSIPGRKSKSTCQLSVCLSKFPQCTLKGSHSTLAILSVKKVENTGKCNFFSWAHCYSR